VDAAYAGGAGASDGTIGRPFTTLQDAIDAAGTVVAVDVTATQIVVAPGTYTENPQVLANQQLHITGWAPGTHVSTAFVNQIPLVAIDGHFVWNLNAGSAGSSYLRIDGLKFDGINISSVSPASTPLLVLGGGRSTAAISSSAFAGACAFDRTTFDADVVLDGAAFVAVNDSAFATDLTVSTLVGSGISVLGTLTQTGAVLELMNSTISALAVASGATVILDDLTLRYLAFTGGLPTPASAGANVWRGSAGYYQLQHTVRQETANFQADLGDEMLVVGATGVVVTLPAAAIFAAAGDETNDGTTRRATRHLIIKCNADANSVAGVLPSGTDLINGQSTLYVSGGSGVTLVPVLQSTGPDVWSWECIDNKSVELWIETSTGDTSTSGTYADIFEFFIPGFGSYKLHWEVTGDVSVSDTYLQVQLWDDTNTTQLGPDPIDGGNTSRTFSMTGTTFFNGAGNSITAKLQFKRAAGTGNAHYSHAVVHLERVA